MNDKQNKAIPPAIALSMYRERLGNICLRLAIVTTCLTVGSLLAAVIPFLLYAVVALFAVAMLLLSLGLILLFIPDLFDKISKGGEITAKFAEKAGSVWKFTLPVAIAAFIVAAIVLFVFEKKSKKSAEGTEGKNELTLKITGAQSLKLKVTVDGKKLKFSKNRYGSWVATYRTDSDSVKIQISKYLEIRARFWYLASIGFFLLSLLGILDSRYDRSCCVYQTEFDVKVTDKSEFMLSCNMPSTVKRRKKEEPTNGAKAFNVKTLCEFTESGNEYYYDSGARLRLNVMRVVKVAIWMAAVALVVFALVRFIG